MCYERIVFVFAIGMLVLGGCDTQPSQDAKSPTTVVTAGQEAPAVQDSAVAPSTKALAAANSPPAPTPQAPAEPTAEQIAQWKVPEFEPLQLLACRDGFGDPAVFGMALSPDGKQFVTGGARLTLWKTDSDEPVSNILENYKGEDVERPLPSVAYSADGKWIAAGDQKGRVRIWTASDQQELLLIQAHSGRVVQVAFSPDSRMLATTSYDGEVNLWQLPEGTKLKSMKVSDQEISRLRFLSDSVLAVAGKDTSLWSVESGTKVIGLTDKYVSAPSLGLSSNKSLLAFNDADGNVQFWDVANSKPTTQVLKGAGAYLVAFSHDGKWVATGARDAIRIWDAETGSLVQVIDSDGGMNSAIAWLPDCNAFVVSTVEGFVRIWGDAESAKTIGIEPIKLPEVATGPADVKKSMSSAQLQRVIDVRSFPRLPGSTPQFSDFGMCMYSTSVLKREAEEFFRYQLKKAGWTETKPDMQETGLTFRKEGCELSVMFGLASPIAAAAKGNVEVTLSFAGNYDVRWLPQIGPFKSKSTWSTLSSTSYRTKADITDLEVNLLKQFHKAGWTAYSRLAASSAEDPNARNLSLLQNGSILTVYISRPADAADEWAVQTSIAVTNKSVPIPADSGWIEFDNSTDMQFVINTKMNLEQTTQFFDTEMAAHGWLTREAGRNFKDDRGCLPYIRGQEDIFLRLQSFPEGGTRIVAGDAASTSWQLEKAAADEKKKSKKTDDDAPPTKPGIEAADITLPADATAVKVDADQKQIEYEVANTTPGKLGDQFVAMMEALGWKREDAGIVSDDYVFITYSKEKAEVQIRARSGMGKATAMISGDGLLWVKPLPTAPVRVSYATWLRRNQKEASLEYLDEFAAEMHKIPAAASK